MLRLFGAPDAAVGAAVGQFPPQWNAAAQWKSRGAETLVALSAQSAAGLKKAVGALRETFSADLYGAGETTLAEAVVAALEGHDRLLICSDAAAGTLLEARLETVPGAEKVFDFGALSYAHPKAGAQIEKRARARLPKGTTDPVRLALARAQAARRVVGADLAAGCAEREQDCVLILSSKKGCWLRTVQRTDKPALWLLDMIRRARRVLAVLLVLAALAALAAAGAWVYTGGNFYALPQRLHSLWADGVPHAGASFL